MTIPGYIQTASSVFMTLRYTASVHHILLFQRAMLLRGLLYVFGD